MLFLLPGKTLPCPLHTSPPLSSAEFFQDLASLRTLFSDLLTCFLALFPHHGANHMNCVACLSSVSFTRLAALWMGTLSLITEFPASSSVLEKAMATHSSTLAWKIPWAEEPGRLQSMGSRRVGHDWATSLSLFTFMRWRRKWQPTPVFLPGESQGRGSLEGLRLWRSHRVGHDWSDLAAAAAAFLPGESQGPGSLVGCCLWGHTELDMTEAT